MQVHQGDEHMPASDREDFLSVFKMRRDHCRALLTLSRRQSDLIAQNDYTRLMDVLGQKQRLLGSLGELRRAQPALWEQWQASRDALPPKLREQCETLLEESEGFLAQVLTFEKAGTDAITRRRDATQRQLRTIEQGTHVRHAYHNCLAPATHRHLDVGQ